MNLNINCYDLSDELSNTETTQGASFILQLPNKVFSFVKIKNNKLYVVVDIDSLEQTYIQISFIPAERDIKYIDEILNSRPELYQCLGEYEIDNTECIFVFSRILSDMEVTKITND